MHSAKGSTWEEHKYIKRINGLYYYPDSYEGGRHLSDKSKAKFGEDEVDIEDLSDDDIETLALEVIRGNFGNGQDRKDALGAHYQAIQNRVNQILKDSGSIKISNADPNIAKTGKEAVDNAISKTENKQETKQQKTSKGIDLDKVYSVYKRQSDRSGSEKKAASSKKTSGGGDSKKSATSKTKY